MIDPSDFGQLGAALLASPDLALVMADAEGNIVFWNTGAEQIFGYSATEAAGKKVDLVVPEAYREMHWAGFFRRMGTNWRGSDAFDALEARHRDGSLIPLEFFLLPLRREDGLMTSVAATFRRPKAATED